MIRYGRCHGTTTLIETGTYLGETVASCLPHFKRIYTIELDQALYEAARERFKGKPVAVIHGDSLTELSRLAVEVEEPAVFWLDAHYCAGGTAKSPNGPPLRWELRAIIDRRKPDLVLIDDARHMGVHPGRFQQWVRRTFLRLMPTESGYPSIEEIRQMVSERASSFETQRDIIRITLS